MRSVASVTWTSPLVDSAVTGPFVPRTLTSPEGLPLRAWYQHLLYAPGYYTGYGVKTMPAAREAIEQKDWASAEREIARIAAALTNAAAHIERIAQRLEGNGR